MVLTLLLAAILAIVLLMVLKHVVEIILRALAAVVEAAVEDARAKHVEDLIAIWNKEKRHNSETLSTSWASSATPN